MTKIYDLTTVAGRIEISVALEEAEARITELEGQNEHLQETIRHLDSEVEGLKEQLGAAGYVPRPALPPKFITEPTYDEPTVPPPLTDEG